MVNRSTYYKHFFSPPAKRTNENQLIKSNILNIYAEHKKRLGMYKIYYLLKCDYGINISCGRVYRLMKQMNLPVMSTRKPKFKSFYDQNEYDNHLQQNFNQNAPNTVYAVWRQAYQVR